MKHSQTIGVIAVLALVGICYIPWSFIESKNIVLTGLNTAGTEFGRPGLVNIALGTLALILFIIPTIWAKRINIFVGAINLAWSIRNYLLLTSCFLGDCPEKRPGIYLLLFASVTILVMSLLPKVNMPEDN